MYSHYTRQKLDLGQVDKTNSDQYGIIKANAYIFFQVRVAMDDHMQRIVETVAHLLLQRFRAEQPQWINDQTPVDSIVSWLGFYVETFYAGDYPKGTYGFMDPDDNENLIWLSRDLSETLRSFTLAHELGHALLHCQNGNRLRTLLPELDSFMLSLDTAQSFPHLTRTDLCYDNDVAASLDQEQLQEALGIGHNYDPLSQREVAANIFAAELLMPIERVRTLYLVERVPATA